MICERCNRKARVTTGSMFNTEQICMPCRKLESFHPKYAEAVAADEAAIRRGDYNFVGIGLPEDLKPKKKESP